VSLLASDAWQRGRVDVDIAEVVRRLERAQVNLEPGLSAQELSAIEARFGISFNPAHRALLGAALPTGEGWMDWRHGVVDVLRGRLEWPIDGIVFDVHQNGFWPRSWGPRPTAPADAEQVARQYLERVPVLIPVYSHRCTPAAPAPGGSPVFSAYQSDVIVYGDNLLAYVAREFGVGPPAPTPEDQQLRIPFWSSLAAGADNDDL
jgi:hypothetical protein